MLINFVGSENKDLNLACAEICTQAAIEKSPLTLLFLSSHYITPGMQMPDIFSNKNVIACTTSGEISPLFGFSDNSLVGAVFNQENFIADSFNFHDLSNMPNLSNFEEEFARVLLEHKKKMPNSSSLAILLIDGLSTKEERVVNYLEEVLKNIPMVGASAGDNQQFKSTQILINNEFKSNSAKLILLSTNQNFEFFKKDHFFTREKKVIINSADPAKRTVYEIDGYPANVGYAKALNVSPEELSINLSSNHPLVLKMGDENYIRSVQQILPDGSIVFYCAIDEGMVLNIAGRKDLNTEMNHFFEKTKANLGNDVCYLFFECILRKVEINSSQGRTELINMYKKNNVIGFYTYGEQFCGLHINQTLTGVAFGKK